MTDNVTNASGTHSGAAELTGAADIAAVIAQARVVAVIGASQKTGRPAHYVPAYMAAQGYRVIPVNPNRVGDVMFGEPVRASLAEIDVHVDIVDIFRPSAEVAAHVADILAMEPLPGTVWLQRGIRDDAVAAALTSAGVNVVQDRCLLVEHRDRPGAPVG